MPIIETPSRPQKKHKGSPEMHIQAQCVAWFWNTYPQYRELYFCVPNENARADSNAITGAIRRASGVIKGVSDTILLVPNGQYICLCVEFKTETGRQSDAQIHWQIKVENVGAKYVVVRSLEQFKKEIREYLSKNFGMSKK